MQSQQQEGIRTTQTDFKRLQKNQQLPPLMELKLSFLQALIVHPPKANDLGERLDPLERESIQSMSPQTQRRLFIEIVGCLAGRDEITYCKDERGYLRIEGILFSWQKISLNITSIAVTVSTFSKKVKDPVIVLHQLELQRLVLSRSYKKYKNKFILRVDSGGVKNILGFDEEGTCGRIHHLLGQLLQEKKYWRDTKYDNREFYEEREARRMALPLHRIRDNMVSQESQYLAQLREKVREEDGEEGEEGEGGKRLLAESVYRLVGNRSEGRVMVRGSNCVRTDFFIKGASPVQVAACFLQMSHWNPSIQSLSILSRPRDNCFTADLLTHKYNFLSYPRQSTLLLNYFQSCQCSNPDSTNSNTQQVTPTSSYLLIESIASSEQLTNTIELKLKQVVQCLPRKDSKDELFVSITTSAQFNGYCTESDNLSMTLHLAENIQSFLKFVNQHASSYDGYFHDVPCVCVCGKDNDAFQSEDGSSLPSDRNQLNSDSPINMPAEEAFTNKAIIEILEEVTSGAVNPQFLQIMTQQAHHKYYLAHNFTTNDESISILANNNNHNFLHEGSRWKFDKQDLVFIDAEALAAQKDILKTILRQISSNIMKGKSVMSMSLPVEIFDKKSLLDAIADSYGFLPVFAEKIVSARDLTEQMKYVVCAVMFIHATNPNATKPFNPILGETYQGRLGHLTICIEQISHHPPISYLLVKNKDLQFSGNLDVAIDMGLNSVSTYLTQWLRLKIYSTNTEYIIKVPDVRVDGMVYGSRTFQAVGKGFLLQTKHNLFCELSIGRDKKRVYQKTSKLLAGDLIGGIYKVKQEFANAVRGLPKTRSFEGLKPEHVVETCCFLSGKWYGDLSFDGVSYKSKKEGPFPLRAERLKYLLPSDSIWRSDVIYKVWGDNIQSNSQKEILQTLQRKDRKLREKFKDSS